MFCVSPSRRSPRVAVVCGALLPLLLLLLLAGCGGEPSSKRNAATARRKKTPAAATAAAELSVAAKPAAPAFSSLEDATRLQVFLDNENFGPGKIDGRGGEFTRKALARYGRARGLGALTTADPNLTDKLPGLARTRAFTDYTLTTEDAAQVGVMPETHEEQGKAKSLPYTSLHELLAERVHAERAFLQKINPGKNLAALKVGDTVRVPLA